MTPADSNGSHDPAITAARPGERRIDERLIRAQIDREREEARLQARITERQAAAQLRREDADARTAAREKARQRRATGRAAVAAWCAARTVDLLFVPVIGVPALLSWTGMASYGQSEFGPAGLALPGAALNYLHGLGKGGPLMGASMALISVAGVTAHQLITAGPRRSRAEREQTRIDRAIARRERAAGRAVVRHARVQLDDAGHARLVFEAGAAWLSRDRLGRRRLELDDLGPVMDITPVRAAESVPAESVQIPEPVYGPDPVQPTRTDTAHAERTISQTPQGTHFADTQDDLTGDADRRDPAIDRNAVIADLADQIRDAVRAGDRWRPDYAELMAATGRKRSWCEKVVRSARNSILDVPARTDHGDLTDTMPRRSLTPPIANTAPRP